MTILGLLGCVYSYMDIQATNSIIAVSIEVLDISLTPDRWTYTYRLENPSRHDVRWRRTQDIYGDGQYITTVEFITVVPAHGYVIIEAVAHPTPRDAHHEFNLVVTDRVQALWITKQWTVTT